MKIVIYLTRWLVLLKNNLKMGFYRIFKSHPKSGLTIMDSVCSISTHKELDKIEKKIEKLQNTMQKIMHENNCSSKKLVS
jgi:hypothetical protein